MSSLSFPDINVWMALATPDHVHGETARAWWEQEGGTIAFSRFSQMGLLRLVTTKSAMDGRPLTMEQAWHVYDQFCEDERVIFVSERAEAYTLFRELASRRSASPKVWADAWLLAVAAATNGRLITFDAALAQRGAHCLPTSNQPPSATSNQ